MTFAKFEAIFRERYPNGSVTPHGKFGGTEHNKKVAVVFEPNGYVYEYYGAYDTILNRMGINFISRDRYEWTLKAIERLERENGREMLFGTVIDNTDRIADLKRSIDGVRVV